MLSLSHDLFFFQWILDASSLYLMPTATALLLSLVLSNGTWSSSGESAGAISGESADDAGGEYCDLACLGEGGEDEASGAGQTLAYWLPLQAPAIGHRRRAPARLLCTAAPGNRVVWPFGKTEAERWGCGRSWRRSVGYFPSIFWPGISFLFYVQERPPTYHPTYQPLPLDN
jgi:hypothetical protein